MRRLKVWVFRLAIMVIALTNLYSGPSRVCAYSEGPFITVIPKERWIYGFQWPTYTRITLTIYPSPTNHTTLYSATFMTSIGHGDLHEDIASFDLTGKTELLPGMLVTMTDGTVTRNLVIADFEVTSWDVSANSISGRASPGATIIVSADNLPGKGIWNATADGNGNWIAYASYPNSFVLKSDTYGWAAEIDADGDETRADWNRPNTMIGNIFANPEINYVSLDNDRTDRDYTLTITRSEMPDDPVWSGNGIYNAASNNILFPLRGFDLQVGDILHVSDGDRQKNMVVVAPGTIDIDIDNDTISGAMRPYSMVYVVGYTWRYARADGNGRWSVDFKHPGMNPFDQGSSSGDLAPGIVGEFGEADEDQDISIYHYQTPNIAPITLSTDHTQTNQAVTAGILFEEANFTPGYTIRWDWGDGEVVEDPNPGLPDARAIHRYTQPGIYTISATVREPTGRASETEHYRGLIVTGPFPGIALGNGWFTSPVGASPTNPSLAGKAELFFSYLHPKLLQKPFGITLFKLGGLSFTGTSTEWVVVHGGILFLRGEGKIDGQGRYGFLLSAIDGSTAGAGEDTVRIKIWNAATGQVVYDNQLGAAEDAEPATAMDGGVLWIPKS